MLENTGLAMLAFVTIEGIGKRNLKLVNLGPKDLYLLSLGVSHGASKDFGVLFRSRL